MAAAGAALEAGAARAFALGGQDRGRQGARDVAAAERDVLVSQKRDAQRRLQEAKQGAEKASAAAAAKTRDIADAEATLAAERACGRARREAEAAARAQEGRPRGGPRGARQARAETHVRGRREEQGRHRLLAHEGEVARRVARRAGAPWRLGRHRREVRRGCVHSVRRAGLRGGGDHRGRAGVRGAPARAQPRRRDVPDPGEEGARGAHARGEGGGGEGEGDAADGPDLARRRARRRGVLLRRPRHRRGRPGRRERDRVRRRQAAARRPRGAAHRDRGHHVRRRRQAQGRRADARRRRSCLLRAPRRTCRVPAAAG